MGKDGFVEAVSSRRLLLDGAMGSQLQAAGLPGGTPPEIWNATEPGKVLAVHEAYLEAGAEALETNTFGGSPAKLGFFGLSDRTEELNMAAVGLARRAAGTRAWVLGSIGPSGRLLAPFGDLAARDALEGFERQARAMAEAGADAINIETMSDPIELRLAVAAALATGLPVMAEVTMAAGGRTLYGSPPEVVGAFLSGFSLAAAGLNCSLQPQEIAPLLRPFGSTWHGPLIAQPNAGRPGECMTPGDFARAVVAMSAEGASVVGGCCGTTPDHIARTRALLDKEDYARPPAPDAIPYITSRTRYVRIEAKPPAGPVLALRAGERDPAAGLSDFEAAEVIYLDITGRSIEPAEITSFFETAMPAVDVPVVLIAGEEDVLQAALLACPGRPGVSGPTILSPTAHRFGACWLERV